MGFRMGFSSRKIILREIKKLEDSAVILENFHLLAKNEAGNRLSPFGRAVLEAARQHGVRQTDIAKILDLTPGAVSQHYNS